MRIVEQNDDRLVIEDRKTAPMWQPAFAVAFLTLPLLLVDSWRVRALVAVIWAITAGVYVLITRLSTAPKIVLDAKTGRARIGNLEYALSDVARVLTTPVSNSASLTFTLRIPPRAFQNDDTPGDETTFSSAAASTPAERSRMAKVINAFLDAHRPTPSREDPFRDIAGEYYVSPYEGEDSITENDEEAIAEDESDDEDGSARWAESWDAESTVNRKCFFCATGDGEGGPLQLWAKRDGDVELLFVPRCRRCRRFHDFNRRFAPAFAVLAGLIAGLMLALGPVADALHNDLERLGGIVVVVVGAPVAAFFLSRWMTSPRLFGSKDRDEWGNIPDFQRAVQDGWNLRVRNSTF